MPPMEEYFNPFEDSTGTCFLYEARQETVADGFTATISVCSPTRAAVFSQCLEVDHREDESRMRSYVTVMSTI